MLIFIMNLSFLPCFASFLMICGNQIVFFVVFRGIFEESRTVVRTVCGQCLVSSLCNSLFCPLRHFRLRFLVLNKRNSGK